MPNTDIIIDQITKIEGSAGLRIKIENNKVTDLKFIIQDYRRFYTQAVKGKPMMTVPSFLSRICGTCSVAHLFAAIKAIEISQNIQVTQQTNLLRQLAYDALIIRDHALHLYFFVMPDILGVDSILDIPDEEENEGNILLHDSFDIKQLGTDLSNLIIGAAIHAPFPTIGGFLKNPDQSKFPEMIKRLEKIRPQVIRGIKKFYEWDISLIRNTDYLYLRNNDRFDFLEGTIMNSSGKKIAPDKFHEFLKTVIIPYSQAEGYVFSDTNEDYLVGALARLNFNKDTLNPRTKNDTIQYLSVFPSNNIHHNNLAQAIEILQCVDDAIDILKTIQIQDEKPIRQAPQAGIGVGVVEAPRGLLYHMAEIDEHGTIKNYEVIVPTVQNQINIENDLKKYINDNIEKSEDELRLESEKIIRAYDPCMSCATNFLKIEWIRS